MRQPTVTLLAVLALITACDPQRFAEPDPTAPPRETPSTPQDWVLAADTTSPDAWCAPPDFPLPRELSDSEMASVSLPRLESLVSTSLGDVLGGDVETRGEGLSCYREILEIQWIQNQPRFSDDFTVTKGCVGPDRFRWLEHTDDGVTSS